MRFLMYSQDGLGLGHLRRSRNIAEEILARRPESNILILADSPGAPFFSVLRGLDYLKLPTVVKLGPTDWRPAGLSMPIEEVLELRARVLLQVVDEFAPDVILVDHMPVGALGELKPVLGRLAQSKARPRLFLGLRDVLDAPEVIRAVWADLGAYDYLPGYDEVLVYGCRDIFDADAAYHLTPYARKVTYCHYVVTGPTASPPAVAPADPLVLVIGGGGGDAFPLMRTFVEALPVITGRSRCRALIITGPNMPASQRDALLAHTDGYPVEIQASTEDAIGLLEQATAVVTRAGYNSLCEILQWRKKALVVPRPGPSAEQRIRTGLFAQQRLVRMLDPDALTAARLAEELIGLLTGDGIPEVANVPPMDGAKRAAALLLGEPAAGTERGDPLGLAAAG